MTLLICGLVLFLGIHSVAIVAPAWRDSMAARLGELTWKGAYSVIAIAGFALLIAGFGVARQDPVILYSPPTALHHLALLLMLPVFPLLFAAYFPGRISTAAKHPMLLAVKLWATAHLLANGALADTVLFASLLAWAVADRISLKRRSNPRKTFGAPASRANDVIGVVGGLALYVVVILWAHRWLIGVSPLPQASVN